MQRQERCRKREMREQELERATQPRKETRVKRGDEREKERERKMEEGIEQERNK